VACSEGCANVLRVSKSARVVQMQQPDKRIRMWGSHPFSLGDAPERSRLRWQSCTSSLRLDATHDPRPLLDDKDFLPLTWPNPPVWK
jgi:hypothetical protein